MFKIIKTDNLHLEPTKKAKYKQFKLYTGEFAGNDTSRDLLDTKNTPTQNGKQDIVKSDEICHGDDSIIDNKLSKTPSEHKFKIRWFMVYACIYLYTAGAYGLYLMYTKATWFTFVFSKFYIFTDLTDFAI